MFDAGIMFDPKIYHISPAQGTSAGGVMYVEVIGAGVLDNYTLVDAAGDDICETSQVVKYSLLECHVKAKDYTTPTALSVKNKDTNAVFGCPSFSV